MWPGSKDCLRQGGKESVLWGMDIEADLWVVRSWGTALSQVVEKALRKSGAWPTSGSENLLNLLLTYGTVISDFSVT